MEQVGQRGYRTATTKSELVGLGFTPAQARAPSLLIPIWGVAGDIVGYQIRPDQPRVGKDGKVLKYEMPKGGRMVLDVPPAARAWIGSPRRPLFVTEGIKKADSAASRGLCCVALLGVWNFRGTNDEGGKVALPDWESVALNDRRVYVVFDSDVMVKPGVHKALVRLKAFLESRGAHVAVVYLPAAEGGGKVGLDDYFVSGRSVDDLLSHAVPDVRRQEGDDAEPQPYEVRPDGIWLRGDDGLARLTNFGAWITRELEIDDGQEPRRAFRLAVRLGSRSVEFDVPAEAFDSLAWVTTQIGAGATLLPVHGVERHVRAAIQSTSGISAPRARVLVHTGWAAADGRNVFLHADGAIGESGPVASLSVALDGALAGARLPAPPETSALGPLVRGALRTLALAPMRVTLPLFAGVFRVVLAPCDFSIHMAGATGVFKTATAAVFQQFFGAELDARRLPGSWSSTSNSLESLAFAAKDIVIVVDDFAPTGGVRGVNAMQASAERLLRAQGNRAGRGRCAPDGSLRRERMPRGLVLSTGEDSPRGPSLRARVHIVEVLPGDVSVDRLTEAQAAASRGDHADVMSGFVRWLAPRLNEVRERLPARVREVRAALSAEGVHRRIPGVAADLLFGFEVFLEFAVTVDAIDAETAKAYFAEAWRTLAESVAAQDLGQREAEPHRRFLELLRSAISSGEAHLVDPDGATPPDAIAWGWSPADAANGDANRFVPHGRAVGWVDGADVYLEVESAMRAVQAMGQSTGDPLSVLGSTLKRRLKDARLVKSVDPDGRHIEIQKSLSGGRHRVLHLDASSLLAPAEDSAPAVAEQRVVPLTAASPAPPTPAAPPPFVCFACGGTESWTGVGGHRVCCQCHGDTGAEPAS